jgi:4-methoxybenzoate monooxygenase (O-demethylating)
MAVSTAYPVSDLDPFAAEFIADPYPRHETLRELGPVVRLARYDAWAVARYEQVNAVLMDWETFGSGAGVGVADFRKEKPWRAPSIILEADPPLHTRTHKILARVMSPAALRALRPAFELEARSLVNELLERRRIDGVADAGRAYPLKVFPDAVGLRPDGRENLLPYGNMVFNAIGPRNAILEESMASAGKVIPWITAACARDSLASGGIGRNVYAAVDAGEATEEEAGLLIRSLLSAGLDTTIAAIGNALLCFARFPEQWQALRDDPSLTRQAFDEAMRLESPVAAFFRTTTRPIDLAGVALGEGEKVLTFFAAANRDPRRWERPDAFDVRRRSGGHCAFGVGIHRCVGESLAELEGEVFLTELARRVRSIALDGEPVLHYNNALRSFASIPLILEAA